MAAFILGHVAAGRGRNCPALDLLAAFTKENGTAASSIELSLPRVVAAPPAMR
jgi:hypothetical protein